MEFGTLHLVPEQPLIALKGVRRRYHSGSAELWALDGLDLQVPRGQYVALVGRSGSGKSTLLNVVSGIDAPTAGEVWIEGNAIHSMREPALTLIRRRMFGFIFQFFNLLPTLSVLENILLPGQLADQPASALRKRALELLGMMGLEDRAGSPPDRLSGGEQQRVAICRALINDPPILLADEPTGNLDSETGADVLRLLDQLHREQGRTILLVTHALDAAARAERVVTLKDGRIAGDQSLDARNEATPEQDASPVKAMV